MMRWFLLIGILCSAMANAQDMKPFVRGSFQEIVSARQGKPFIVNFWSLSCTYCGVEMSMLKKLARKYPGLDIVLVSTDTPEDKNALSATLAKYSMSKFDAWVFADSYTERLRFEIDRTWQGELPRTYFYGAHNEVNALSGKLEYKQVERWINAQFSR
jgi:thiol-disulfide isomerase/thioredoxin